MCRQRVGERRLNIICEAAKETMARKSQDMVNANINIPMMTSKSCDGTPMNTLHKTIVKLPRGKRVISSGRSANEFLVKFTQWRLLSLTHLYLSTPSIKLIVWLFALL